MILPETPPMWRNLAHRLKVAGILLCAATKTCIVGFAGVRAYPREASVYTIRTPSPDGQQRLFRHMLPVFFWAKGYRAAATDRSGNLRSRIAGSRFFCPHEIPAMPGVLRRASIQVAQKPASSHPICQRKTCYVQ